MALFIHHHHRLSCKRLLRRNLNLAGLDVVRDVLGAAAIDLAASAESSSENLKHGTLEVLGHRLEPHGAGNGDDLIKRNALEMLDVLLLLAVARRLLERLDDERRGRGNDGDGGLTVLDGQLDSDTETLPVTSGLGDIFTDLLWRQTERTDLGGERGRSTNFTTSRTEVDNLHLGGIDLGSFGNVSAWRFRRAWLLKKSNFQTATDTPIGRPSHSENPPLFVADQKDDTHAWLVLEVVNRFWL